MMLRLPNIFVLELSGGNKSLTNYVVAIRELSNASLAIQVTLIRRSGPILEASSAVSMQRRMTSNLLLPHRVQTKSSKRWRLPSNCENTARAESPASTSKTQKLCQLSWTSAIRCFKNFSISCLIFQTKSRVLDDHSAIFNRASYVCHANF